MILSENSNKENEDNNVTFENIITIGSCYIGTYKDGVWYSPMPLEPYIEVIENSSLKFDRLMKLSNNTDQSGKAHFDCYTQTENITTSMGYIGDNGSNGEFDQYIYGMDFDLINKKEEYLYITEKYNPLPKNEITIKENIINTKEYAKYFDLTNKMISEKGLKGNVEMIDKIISIDIDNDGIMEHFIVANHDLAGDDKTTEKHGGIYNIIYMIKGNSIFINEIYTQIILEDKLEPIRNYDCDVFGIFDQNNDGRNEIIVKVQGWEWIVYIVYEKSNSTFIPVLYKILG